MSNTTTIDAHGAVETSVRSNRTGFWKRFYESMVAARQVQADREIAYYLSGLNDQQRKDLGYPAATDRR